MFVRLLRSEGVAEAIVGVAAFHATGQSWWLFAAVVVAPDLAMFAYLFGSRIGALAYNISHSTMLPCAAAALGFVTGSIVLLAIAAAWFVHIGADRALGYGLKSMTGFRITHLGDIGGSPRPSAE